MHSEDNKIIYFSPFGPRDRPLRSANKMEKVIFSFNIHISDFPMILNAYSVLLGLLSSMFIGVVFGFFPARNAANLNPISALSKE